MLNDCRVEKSDETKADFILWWFLINGQFFYANTAYLQLYTNAAILEYTASFTTNWSLAQIFAPSTGAIF